MLRVERRFCYWPRELEGPDGGGLVWATCALCSTMVQFQDCHLHGERLILPHVTPHIEPQRTVYEEVER